MIKKVIVIILVCIASISYAQEGTSSPYSFYGIGLKKFKGTIENRSMGGLSILSDSIHLNLQNPAAYGELRLTTYAVGANYNRIYLNDGVSQSESDNATLDYLAIGIPTGKFGFGFGLMAYSAVGYKLNDVLENGDQRILTGKGGMNKVFLAAGYKLNESINIGLDFNYNFGNIETKEIITSPNVQFSTRETIDSNLSGISISVGVNYKTYITEKLRLTASVVSRPSFKLSSKNEGELSTITLSGQGSEIEDNSRNLNINNRDFDLPSDLKVGGGIGAPKNWFVGGEYVYKDMRNFESRSVDVRDIEYQNASEFKLGGYYIPNYSSLTSYFKRVVYRAGFRYEETGLNISGQSIDEFGMSFGVGLPIGNAFSSLNIGLEYGQRGTTDFGLVKEDFFNFSISLSLNDRWFRKLKFN